ncbi:hypothetical protein EIP91_012104 [Steccherinum ochraceum]|uniref:Uncharacterized protein n=1 Tax=Steccherinum ochraceum TaxID=92696 RepID=A0A4R0RTA6_9APHY|nr:hypothetical protein EIP91_012104 [Steccherinum ochraceum]
MFDMYLHWEGGRVGEAIMSFLPPKGTDSPEDTISLVNFKHHPESDITDELDARTAKGEIVIVIMPEYDLILGTTAIPLKHTSKTPTIPL